MEIEQQNDEQQKNVFEFHRKTVAKTTIFQSVLCIAVSVFFVYTAHLPVCVFVSIGHLFSLTHAHVQIDYLSYGGWCVDSSVDRTHKCGQHHQNCMCFWITSPSVRKSTT